MTEDPKLLWQDQPKEEPEMGLEQVRARVRAYQTRALRTRVVIVVVALATTGVMGAVATQSMEPGGLVGDILLLGGILVSMTLAWRRLSPQPSGDDAAASVAFLRARLLERRRAGRGGWVWVVAPVFPGMVVKLATLSSAAGALWWPRMGPIIGWCVIWLVLLLLTQWRQGAKVTVEIAELDRLGLS